MISNGQADMSIRYKSSIWVCKSRVLYTHSENQEEKGIWWMPWRLEAKKDVALCEKSRGDESDL